MIMSFDFYALAWKKKLEILNIATRRGVELKFGLEFEFSLTITCYNYCEI